MNRLTERKQVTWQWKLTWTIRIGFGSIPLKQKADKTTHNLFLPRRTLFFPATEPFCMFRKIIYTICSQTRDSAGWIIHKYYLYCPDMFWKIHKWQHTFMYVVSEVQGCSIQKVPSLNIYQNSVIWRIVLVFPNKNPKILENTWYFKTHCAGFNLTFHKLFVSFLNINYCKTDFKCRLIVLRDMEIFSL